MEAPLPPIVTVLPDPATLAEAAAEHVAAQAATATAARGRFTIALSGGSTPKALYARLADPAWRDAIDWSAWHVFWGDERLVPPDDPNSNVGLAERALLARVPIPAAQVYRVPVDAGGRVAVARAYEAVLRRVFDLAPGAWPRFDLVLLGLGGDGHTASLFPGHPALDEHTRLVVGTPPGTLPPTLDRVTLTLPVLNTARAVTFLAAGADKAAVLRRVLAGAPDLPAARVRPVDGEVRWLIDAAAAGEG